MSFDLAPQSQLVQLAAFVKAGQIGVDEEQGDPMGSLEKGHCQQDIPKVRN